MSSKYIKILAAVAILMELATFAALAASVYTLSGSFMRTLIPQDEGAFKLEHGDGKITAFSIDAKNTGVFEMKMSMDMKLLADGRAIAEGGDSVLVPPGSSGRLEVGLAAPPTAEVRDEKLEILITLEGRTFFELAGIGISTRWGGEYA